MEIAYAFKVEGKEKASVAMGRDLNIPFKDAVNLTKMLKGMKLQEAIKAVEGVENMERHVPYRKFKKGVGHRKGTDHEKVGKFPVKAAGEMLKILNNLQSNAEYKGLEPENLKIVQIQALKGVGRRRRKPKGRWATWETQYVHIQVLAREK